MAPLGVASGRPQQARHGILGDVDETGGGAHPASCAQRVDDGRRLFLRNLGIAQGSATSLGELLAARPAAQEPDAVLAVDLAHGRSLDQNRSISSNERPDTLDPCLKNLRSSHVKTQLPGFRSAATLTPHPGQCGLSRSHSRAVSRTPHRGRRQNPGRLPCRVQCTHDAQTSRHASGSSGMCAVSRVRGSVVRHGHLSVR